MTKQSSVTSLRVWWHPPDQGEWQPGKGCGGQRHPYFSQSLQRKEQTRTSTRLAQSARALTRIELNNHSMPKKKASQGEMKTISTTVKLEALGHLLSPLYQWKRELLVSGICSFATEWFLIPKDFKKNGFKGLHKGHLEIEKFHKGIIS